MWKNELWPVKSKELTTDITDTNMDELDSDLEQCLKDWTDLSNEYAVSTYFLILKWFVSLWWKYDSSNYFTEFLVPHFFFKF